MAKMEKEIIPGEIEETRAALGKKTEAIATLLSCLSEDSPSKESPKTQTRSRRARLTSMLRKLG